MSYHHRHHHDDGGGCLIMAILAVVAMPLVGLYLMTKEVSGTKAIGIILLIVGVIIWIAALANT